MVDFAGYKMCARLYLNGDGIGQGRDVSLFFVIMNGPYDPILSWPFAHRVTMQLLDQSGRGRHVQEKFKADPNSSSFQQPRSEMNVATGCSRFISLKELEGRNGVFIRDNTIFIRIIVEWMSYLGPAALDYWPPDCAIESYSLRYVRPIPTFSNRCLSAFGGAKQRSRMNGWVELSREAAPGRPWVPPAPPQLLAETLNPTWKGIKWAVIARKLHRKGMLNLLGYNVYRSEAIRKYTKVYRFSL